MTRGGLSIALIFNLVACSGALGGGSFEEQKQADPGSETAAEEDTDPGVEPEPGSDSGAATTDSATTDTKTAGPDTATTTTDTGPSTVDTAGDPPVMGLPLIGGLAISEVAVFQGVKVSVEKGGTKVTARPADVIAGREALVRVYVTPMAGWTAREVLGELKLVSGGVTKTFSASMTPSAASTDASLPSTLNFSVPTGVIAVDSQYSVALYAKSGAASGDTSGAKYPSSGVETLDAKSTGETLKIKLVPLQYTADGSGRLPDTSPAQIERYRKAFYGMYPAKTVEISVRAPYPWATTIAANGSGFSTVLQAMVKLRQTDSAPKDVYYHGIFAPRDSFSSYCAGSCVTGLCGLLTSPADSTGRACVGVGFTGDDAARTAIQEIGHAFGRSHAPCGVSDADPKYPYSGGVIGSWGYDLVDKKLYSPTTSKDLMGYCTPVWVSDYTFKAFATRMAYIAGAPLIVTTDAAPRTFRFVDIAADGKLTWGDSITLTEPPLSDPHTVSYVAEDGATIETATGFYYPYGGMPGGYMLVPEAPARAIGIRVDGIAAFDPRLTRATLKRD